jgi:hypothetical protein
MNVLSKANVNIYLRDLRIWDLLINLTKKIVSKECAKHLLYSIGDYEGISNVCVEKICVENKLFSTIPISFIKITL